VAGELVRTQRKLAKVEQQIKTIRLRRKLRRLSRERSGLIGQLQGFIIGTAERIFGGTEKK